MLLSIFYNSNVKWVLNKDYLNNLESIIENQDTLQQLIKELSDNNRLESIRTKSYSGTKSLINEMAKPLVFPLTIEYNDELSADEDEYYIFKKINRPNKHFVGFELLAKSITQVSFSDFSDVTDVESFFSMISDTIIRRFSISYVFNRDIENQLIGCLKGKTVHYFTLVKRGHHKLEDARENLRDLKNVCGGKTKVFFTRNPRLIHERKVLIENVLITCDNAFSNLIPSEPTWSLTVSFNPETFTEWLSKKSEFSLLRG
jgi:hypothetical protein